MYVLLVWLLLWCSGCQSSGQLQSSLLSAYDHADVSQSQNLLQELEQQRGAETDLVALDRAVTQLMSADPQAAIRELEQVRKRLQYLQQTSGVEESLATVSDDSALSWSGRSFERQMLNNLQVLSALIAADDDAGALASRGVEQLRQEAAERESVEDEHEQMPGVPDASFVDDAGRLATWLSAALQAEHIQNTDLTNRLIAQLVAWEEHDAEPRLSQLKTFGTRTDPGTGTLQLITLSGRITDWIPEQVQPTSAALLIADRILSATADHSLPPTVASVEVARPRESDYTMRLVTHVSVGTHGSAQGRLVADLNRCAHIAWQRDRDQQIARAVVRRVVKKGAVYGTKDALQVEKGTAADFALNLAGVLWEAQEEADLRYWSLLPAGIEITQMQLPAGDHRVQLQVVSATASASIPQPLETRDVSVSIVDGRNTWVLCFRPQQKLQAIQVSRSPQ